MKEIKELNKELFHLGMLTIVSSPQLDLQIHCNPNQDSRNSFWDIDQLYLKFIWRDKRPKIANTVLKEKKRGLILRNFENYCKTTVIKTVWYWGWSGGAVGQSVSSEQCFWFDSHIGQCSAPELSCQQATRWLSQ